jgi:hypothetical protein
LAVGAVISEPFSMGRDFPDTQGKYREFSRFRAFLALMHGPVLIALLDRIPYAIEQGKILAEQGIDSAEQGIVIRHQNSFLASANRR